MSSQFVFVHGWGMSPNFWDPLIGCLPEAEMYKVDLGFIGEQQSLSGDAAEDAVYVTHSLGTVWALKNRPANIKALVAINGFGCFKNFADERVLRAMKTRLKKYPKAQMRDFWEMSDLPASDNLNVERLKEGLEWLASWDFVQMLTTLKCPVLALAGCEDPILPMTEMKKEWDGFDLHLREGGSHALPVSDPQWCANHIKEFLRNA